MQMLMVGSGLEVTDIHSLTSLCVSIVRQLLKTNFEH